MSLLFFEFRPSLCLLVSELLSSESYLRIDMEIEEEMERFNIGKILWE